MRSTYTLQKKEKRKKIVPCPCFVWMASNPSRICERKKKGLTDTGKTPVGIA